MFGELETYRTLEERGANETLSNLVNEFVKMECTTRTDRDRKGKKSLLRAIKLWKVDVVESHDNPHPEGIQHNKEDVGLCQSLFYKDICGRVGVSCALCRYWFFTLP